jgi:uncharacterized membrane protein
MSEHADKPSPGNAAVKAVMIAGVAVSAALMLAGTGLSHARGQALPKDVVALNDLPGQLLAPEPAAFLTLGLLALIATPPLGVFTLLLVFLTGRQWRFVGVTAVVLLLLAASYFLGKG